MSEPAFESTFRSWCESASVDWTTLRYPRPEAGGETRGHRLRPRGEVRGGVLVVHGTYPFLVIRHGRDVVGLKRGAR